MTWARGIALTLAFVGAVALGVLAGPYITHRDRSVNDTVASGAAASTAVEQTVPEHARPAHAAVRTKKVPAKTASTSTPAKSAGATPREVPAAAPALHERLKPLLNKGADMGKAAEDFGSAEQFAAVAHAARNTDIPFMVLKHHTVTEGKNLEEAIREFKPDVNASAEARKAREQAKADVSALTTG
jgi:hypothetical protein